MLSKKDSKLSKISSQWIKYDIPQETLEKLPWGETYVGQTQKWFIFFFLGNDEEINVLYVVIIVNMILGSESLNYSTADINSDNDINVQDIIILIAMILD